MSAVERANLTLQSPFNAAWFIRRFFMALAILTVSVSGLAWLTHSAIEDGTPGKKPVNSVSVFPSRSD
jgi:hypothetical protein